MHLFLINANLRMCDKVHRLPCNFVSAGRVCTDCCRSSSRPNNFRRKENRGSQRSAAPRRGDEL